MLVPDADTEPSAVGRVSRFDRPPPPHDWRWWVGGLGKTLIAAGLLMFGFVAYQLWGTGIEAARAQHALENEFEELLAGTTPSTTTISTAGTSAPDGSVPEETLPSEPPVQDLPAVEEGDPVARLEIPSIGSDHIVVAGVSKSDLKKGPGHYPETPMPGQLGNAAIAAHRTTYGQPFFDIDKVQNGDEIIVITLAGRYVYRVTGQQIVSSSDYQVIATVDPTRATLTLTSCHPKWTARERIIISAELDPAASSAPAGQAMLNYGRPLGDDVPEEIAPTSTIEPDGSAPESVPTSGDSAADDPTGTTPAATDSAIDEGIADAFAEGWFSDPAAIGQVALWGALLAAIGIGSWLISRRVKRVWVGLLVGTLPFVFALYFFYQNVNRLLPPNL